MRRIIIDNKTGEKVSDLTIYKFELFDAWGGIVHSVEVRSDNTVCIVQGEGFGIKNSLPPVAVSEKTVNRIVEIIDNNRKVLTYRKAISPMSVAVLDGYTENFFFRCGDMSNTVNSYNLFYCDDDDLRARTIKSVHKQITDILVAQGFEKEYFLLYKPRYFDENELLDIEDALEAADKYMPDIEYCEETGDAFVFYDHNLMTVETEGPQPVVILKKGGKRVTYLEYTMQKEELGLKQEDHATIEEYVLK